MGKSDSLLFFLFFFMLAFCGSGTHINDNVLASSRSAGRSLLQEKKSCPLNFEFMNYTVLTSKCKGPQYPPKLCCEGFKEFACSFAEEINDGTNDCATTMFSYINLYGKYPPGLFASECREGKEGLECPANSTSSLNDTANVGQSARRRSPVAVLMAGFLLFLMFFF